MKNSIVKQDKLILSSFLENNIPSCIKFDDELPSYVLNELKNDSQGDWDLMAGYEELAGFSDRLLHNKDINLSRSSFGSGETFITTPKYKDILLALANNSDDIELKIHCYLSLTTVAVLQKYAMQ